MPEEAVALWKDQREYRYLGGAWFEANSVHDGTFDPLEDRNIGHFSTLSHRVMDAVRAAVDDEIEATQQAIRDLGFEVPS